MTFSKEDRAAWLDSEIMQEFEKIARETDVLGGPPAEAFQPIQTEESEEKVWEEESDEDKLLSAIEELGVSEEEEGGNEDLKEELAKVYTASLLTNLKKLAYQSTSMKIAYRIERSIMRIKNMRGGR